MLSARTGDVIWAADALFNAHENDVRVLAEYYFRNSGLKDRLYGPELQLMSPKLFSDFVAAQVVRPLGEQSSGSATWPPPTRLIRACNAKGRPMDSVASLLRQMPQAKNPQSSSTAVKTAAADPASGGEDFSTALAAQTREARGTALSRQSGSAWSRKRRRRETGRGPAGRIRRAERCRSFSAWRRRTATSCG